MTITKETIEEFKNKSQDELNEYLRDACGHENDLEFADFLLTSTELPINADIHYANDWSLTYACEHGNVEIITYLLSSPKLKEHAHMNADAFAYVARTMNKNPKLMEFLIFEYNLQFDKEMEKTIDLYPQIKKMFDLRDLNKKLNEEVVQKDDIKRLKV